MGLDCGRKRKRPDVERDRLSSLPNDLIFRILSFISFKFAIQTCVLSSRWRFIWTSMPYLNFSTEDFSSLPKFSKVVTEFLSRRHYLMEVLSVKLTLHGRVSQAFVKRVLNYAFSHNVQQITISCLLELNIEFPLSFFSSRCLKYLTLIGCTIDPSITPGSTWELPALTTLHLDHVTLFDDVDDDDDNDNSVVVFSKCGNLENLTLNSCIIKGLDSDSDSAGFSICHPQLSNLTLENGYWGFDLVYVDAPQLKSLAVVNCGWVHVSAPILTFVIYRSGYSLELSMDSVPNLETVDICIREPHNNYAHDLVRLLQQFNSVKCLTINLETIELLSSSELVSDQPSPFAKLEHLKIYPAQVLSDGQPQKKVNVSNEVRKYLLASSPSATFTMVTHEEIEAARNTTMAQNLMAELRVLLKQETAKIDKALIDSGKAPMKSDTIKWHEQGKAQVWTQMQPLQLEKVKTCYIVSKLQDIQGVLKKLPTSNRAKMEACFSSLFTEASLVMKKRNRVMIQCDTKASL